MSSKQDTEVRQASPVQWVFEVVAIGALLALVAVGVVRLWSAFDDAISPWYVPVCALVGYLAADFMTGMAHWLADRYGTAETPLIGALFIAPFREHHVDPKGITRHGFVEVNGNNCICSLPFLVAGHLLWSGPQASTLASLLFGSLLCFVLAIFMTNQFHRWAHMETPPKGVVWLQGYRLILSPEHHQKHHTRPYASHYCITSGWLNGPLGLLGFWSAMEALMLWVCRIRIAAEVDLDGGFISEPIGSSGLGE